MDSLRQSAELFAKELIDAARPALEADATWRRRIEEHIKSIEGRLKRIEDGYGIDIGHN